MKNSPKKTGNGAATQRVWFSFIRRAAGSLVAICLNAGSASAQAPAQNVPSVPDNEVRKIAQTCKQGDPMFIEIHTREYQIYLGQTLRVDYDVYVEASRGQVYYDVIEPDFKFWYSIEGTTPRSSYVSLDNKSYQKEPFATYYITPSKAGRLPLPRLFVRVPFLDGKPWITSTPKFIEVIPPPPPIPENYAIANVGEFQIESKISSNQTRVGQTLVLYFTITANTSSSGITPVPYQLNDLSNNFKSLGLMRDKISEKIEPTGVRTTIQYHMQLIALTPGVFTLPPLSLISFDPAKHKYVTVSSSPIQVAIDPSNIVESLPENDISLAAFKHDDIRPIELRRSTPSPDYLWLYVFTPPLAFLAVALSATCRDKRKKRIDREKKRRKLLELEDAFLSATNSQEQLRSLRDIAKLVFNIETRVSYDDVVEQFKSLFTTKQQETARPILQKLMINSASTHTPLTAKEAIDMLNVLRPYYE